MLNSLSYRALSYKIDSKSKSFKEIGEVCLLESRCCRWDTGGPRVTDVQTSV